MEAKDMITSKEGTPLYVGVEIHERESQLANLELSSPIIMEKRILTSSLESFIASLPREKHVAVESVGFIYPKYVGSRSSNPVRCLLPVQATSG